MDLYKILNIEKTASNATIKKSYRALALKYHPDKNPNIDIKKFHEIQTAYDILIDEEKRKRYDNLTKDEFLDINLIFTKLLSKIDSVKNFNKIKVQFMNILTNPKNIINMMNLISKDNIEFDDILDIVSNLKTNNLLSTETEDVLSEYQATAIKSNLDIELNINTNMKDVYNNKLQEIIYMRKVNNRDVKETVRVPLIGDQVVFEELGDHKENITGDLLVNVKITNHMKYKKKGNDLVIRFEISLYQLFNGLVFSFIHLDEKEITIQIDDCFKYGFDGRKFNYVIKEKGILDADDNRGNLIIHFLLNKDENFDEKLLRFFS
jgi:DnaJ-class molecular chaperone